EEDSDHRTVDHYRVLRRSRARGRREWRYRISRRLGSRQRVVYRNLTCSDRWCRQWRFRRRNHALGGRSRPGMCTRSTVRWRAGRHHLALHVLRRRRTHGDRLRHDRRLPGAHPETLGTNPAVEPLRALSHRGLLTVSITALLYNWGFFTIMGYAPYPMEIGVYALGFVFFGWGVLVAIFAVFVAPRVRSRIGSANAVYATLVLMAIDLAVIATWVQHPTVVMIGVVISGAFIGMNNT